MSWARSFYLRKRFSLYKHKRIVLRVYARDACNTRSISKISEISILESTLIERSSYFELSSYPELTLDSLLRFSSRKSILSFFMFSQQTLRTLILYQRCLLKRTRSDCIVMRSCNNCSRLKKKCCVSNKSNKYIKYVRLY